MASKKELKAEIAKLRAELIVRDLNIAGLKTRIEQLEARPPMIVRGPVWSYPPKYDEHGNAYDPISNPPFKVTTVTDADTRKYRVWQ